MDYKKIFKSRKTRVAILRWLRFIPDKQMLQMQYFIKTGRRLNLKNPQRYTEKLQWYKLYHRDPEMIRCVDKYDVRSYVEELGLGYILNECYGVYETAEEVDFDKLPNQFVLKDTLGGGGNSVIIVKDKASTDLEAIRTQMQQWVCKRRVRGGGREWPYYSGKEHRIIVERYIESDENNGGLIDYKFFCFNGKCEFIYVMGDRRVGQSVKVSIFDRNFKKLSVMRVGDEEYLSAKEPENFRYMVEVAEKLASKFPHVRVDMYNAEGKVIFGELTFYNASGYMKYDPDEFDFTFGKDFELRKFGFGKNV